MARLSISFACGLYDRMLPLYTGEVAPEGIDLHFVAIESPREIFDRMASRAEFDVAEFSASEFIAMTAAGKSPFVALPAFPSRVFRHGFITINRSAGIREPRDLEGKRIGVPLYTMTAAVWMRGHLRHEYGVDLSGCRWVQGAINEPFAHGHPAALPPLRPPPMEDNRSGRTLGDLLDAGEIAAIMGTSLPAAIKHNPDVVRLFPNFREVEKDYYRRTGIFPIMHLVVIRRELYERHPFVAASLYDAMCASKARALAKMRSLGSLRYMLPWMADDLDEMDAVFGDDPWPYGIEPNRRTLQTLVQYMVEQALVAAPIDVDRLFVRGIGTQ
jgi:4,5-dihydroxyphthalate decarboxylase